MVNLLKEKIGERRPFDPAASLAQQPSHVYSRVTLHEHYKTDLEGTPRDQGPFQEWRRFQQVHPALCLVFLFLGLCALGILSFLANLTANLEPLDPIESYWAINLITLFFFALILYVMLRQEQKFVRRVQKLNLKVELEEMIFQVRENLENNPDASVEDLNGLEQIIPGLLRQRGSSGLEHCDSKSGSQNQVSLKQPSLKEVEVWFDREFILRELGLMADEIIKDENKLKELLPRYVSQDLNILQIPRSDRNKIALISLSYTFGIVLFIYAVQIVHRQVFSLACLLVFGGMAPSVMNLRIRLWMAYECKIKNFLQLPTKRELVIDVVAFGLTFLGCCMLAFGVGVKNSKEPLFQLNYLSSPIKVYHDLVAFVFALLAGISLGICFGEIRILCHFKQIRERQMDLNYNHMKPILYCLIVSQALLPVLAYPVASLLDQRVEEAVGVGNVGRYSASQGLFALVGAIMLTISLNALGLALEHVHLSQNAIQSMLCVVPTLVAICLEVFVNRKGKFFASLDGSRVGSIVFLMLSIFLVVVP
mmetsp:Transcript_9322/g.15714  ORF Transcript_9322/g.15714 Transcript_9322/m.15714 type:complete len:536 (+) Transcript_9322:39-1646(+)